MLCGGLTVDEIASALCRLVCDGATNLHVVVVLRLVWVQYLLMCKMNHPIKRITRRGVQNSFPMHRLQRKTLLF